MFVDNVELSLLSGAGGSGSISFKSKGTKSSPNGGSGGDGGSIYFKPDKKFMTLVQFIQIVHLKLRMEKMLEKIFKMEKAEKIYL